MHAVVNARVRYLLHEVVDLRPAPRRALGGVTGRRQGRHGASTDLRLQESANDRCQDTVGTYVPFVRVAAQEASTKAVRSALLPLVVWPLLRLPADSLLPGHTPAQLATCLAEGKRPISTPISAMIVWAVRSPTPGILSRSSTASFTQGSRQVATSFANPRLHPAEGGL